MTAPHFFVDPEAHGSLRAGERVLLSEQDSRHALRSRRLRPGEQVTISNGRSWLGRGALAGQEGGRAVVELAETWPIEFPRTPEVDVTLAPPKGDRLRWAVQKLGELGVDHLKLVETERSVRNPSEGVLARLRVVAREAAMQSSQALIMEVGVADGLPQAAVSAEGPNVMLHEGATDRLGAVLPDRAGRIHLLVGPEGGFSDAEVDRAVSAGCLAASLGPAILRTETAAVVGATLVLARYGRLG